MVRSIDIEKKARDILAEYYTAFCPPLPASYTLPFVRVSALGGSMTNFLDNFGLVVEGYAETEEEACEVARNAVGILRERLWAVRVVSEPSSFVDPVRPDLCRYRAQIEVTEHMETFTL